MPLAESTKVDTDTLILEEGRQRISPLMVYIYLCIRGQLGSLKSQETQRFLNESNMLMLLLQQHSLKKPGLNTILDNINALSIDPLAKTLDAAF